MKKCSVGTHKNCVELVSGDFRIAVTTAVGPRVIGGFIGKSDNIFKVLPNREMKGIKTGFKLYGGHRLWHSPEAAPRSYAADNEPVRVTETEDGVLFENDPEGLTGIQKSILIESLGENQFRLTHVLRNCNQWDIALAPWALSVMAPGGMAVIPQARDPQGYPYAPNRSLTLWAYSTYADPRIVYGDKYIGYVNGGVALVKYFDVYDRNEYEYPDNGCNVESYSCADFCEIETVAPLYTLAPGDECEHVEVWQGIAGLPAINNEADIVKRLEPKLL